MKHTTLIIITLFSINLLFAFEKNNKKNFMLVKTNNPLDSVVKVMSLQDQERKAFRKGVIVISAGYGLGNFTRVLFTPYESFNAFTYKSIGPVHVKGEYALSDKIGMGLSINYISGYATWNDTYDQSTGQLTNPSGRWGFSSLGVLLRTNIHFVRTKKLDTYCGIGAGYRQEKWTFSSIWPVLGSAPTVISTTRVFGVNVPPTFGFETTVGLRYYFTKNIGVYTEIGFAKAIIQAGLAVKF